MICEALVAERVTIDGYRDFIAHLADTGSTTSDLLKGILAVEEGQASAVSELLAGAPKTY